MGVKKCKLNIQFYFLVNVARDAGYKKITMHARLTAIGFYKKLGYKTHGTEFLELSIPHYMMEKKLF